MTLSSGAHLGPYEIVSPLGAGGVGEVYRARDTKLGRDVAIKLLLSSFAVDPDRLHRFEQEACAGAALNHPHIAHIYEIGASPAVSAGSSRGDETHFIAMEFIEGETLREKIYRDVNTERKYFYRSSLKAVIGVASESLRLLTAVR